MLRALESKNNFNILISQICIKYNIDSKNESNIINILNYLKPLDSNKLISKFNTIEEVNKFIINGYGEYLKTNFYSLPDEIDKTKNYLNKVIKVPGDDSKNISSLYKNTFSPERLEGLYSKKEKLENNSSISAFLSSDEQSKIDFVKYINYESLYRDEHIILDTRYQNTTNQDRTKIVFTLQSNIKTKKTEIISSETQGGINIGSSIKDIIEIQISPFTIPYKPIFDNFYQKITLTINEWTSNSFQAYEDGAFHFIFTIEKIDNNLIYLYPVDNVFRFVKPVNYIDSFTLSFGGMLSKLIFDKDRMSTSNINYSSKRGEITFNEKHNLVSGDLIYITNFTTLDPALDSEFIKQVNRKDGHIITKKNDFSILINMDMNDIRHPESPQSSIYPIDSFYQLIDIYFASKRIQIPITLKHLIQANPI